MRRRLLLVEVGVLSVEVLDSGLETVDVRDGMVAAGTERGSVLATFLGGKCLSGEDEAKAPERYGLKKGDLHLRLHSRGRKRRWVDLTDQPGLNLKQLSSEWFAIREGKITASRVAAYAGLHRYTTLKEAWRIATKRKVVEDNLYMQLGRRDEGAIRDACTTVLTRLTRGPVTCHEVGCFARDRFLASPDGVMWLPDARMHVALELKRPYSALYEEAPFHYVVQCLTQLYCMGLEFCVLAAGIPDGGGCVLKMWLVQFNDEAWERYMEAARRFYDYYVVLDNAAPNQPDKREHIRKEASYMDGYVTLFFSGRVDYK